MIGLGVLIGCASVDWYLVVRLMCIESIALFGVGIQDIAINRFIGTQLLVCRIFHDAAWCQMKTSVESFYDGDGGCVAVPDASAIWKTGTDDRYPLTVGATVQWSKYVLARSPQFGGRHSYTNCIIKHHVETALMQRHVL